jgi:hypothetical protein
MNQQALSFERNARNSPYASGGLGVSSPRVRSSSFSGIGSSPLIGAYPRLPLLSNRIGTHSGSSLMSPLSGLGNPALQRERLRSQTRALEAEALRRVRSSASARTMAEDLADSIPPAGTPRKVPFSGESCACGGKRAPFDASHVAPFRSSRHGCFWVDAGTKSGTTFFVAWRCACGRIVRSLAATRICALTSSCATRIRARQNPGPALWSCSL